MGKTFDDVESRVNKFQYRKSKPQFRSSAHQLAIWKCRHKRLNKNKRCCGHVKNMQVEDEFLFSIECTAYEKEWNFILEEACIQCKNFPYISKY